MRTRIPGSLAIWGGVRSCFRHYISRLARVGGLLRAQALQEEEEGQHADGTLVAGLPHEEVLLPPRRHLALGPSTRPPPS